VTSGPWKRKVPLIARLITDTLLTPVRNNVLVSK